MALEVRLSDRARGDIEDIAEYLANNWSEKTKMDFLIRLTSQLELISKMPRMCRESRIRPGFRECIIDKNTIIYYQIENDNLIKVFSVRNTSQSNS